MFIVFIFNLGLTELIYYSYHKTYHKKAYYRIGNKVSCVKFKFFLVIYAINYPSTYQTKNNCYNHLFIFVAIYGITLCKYKLFL